MTEQTFNHLGLDTELTNLAQTLNFEHPTTIQQRVIPSVLNQHSVIGESHTGSGKTHAFLLPLFNMLDKTKSGVQFVVIAPTRELASQIHDKVKTMVQKADKQSIWTSYLVVGGTDKQKMMDKLKTPPDIIVGTPGRILDMVEEGVLSIYTASSCVIDEADLMAELGLINDVDKLLTRSHPDIQLLAFSATIPVQLEHFFRKYMQNPVHIKLDDQPAPPEMSHLLIARRHRHAVDIITEMSKVINPYLALIFTNGKEEADRLSDDLNMRGLKTGVIHGGLEPRTRKRRLKEIHNLQYQYVVATDLAARGIDIEGVSHIINAQLPKEVNFYLHRVGRTARAGLSGTAISFYGDEDTDLLENLVHKGIEFQYTDVKHGKWVDTKPYNARSKQKQTDQNIDKQAWKQVKKPKKVKPGYKKKMKQEQARIKQHLKKNDKNT